MTAILLDTFTGRLRLHGVLTTRTGLHIGAGGSGDALGTDAPVVRTAGGIPYIPGSSLKGVLRSAAEALFRGGPGQKARKPGLWACDPIAGKDRVCVTHERTEQIRAEEAERAGKDREPDSRRVAEQVWEESCGICRLFGSLALASRVRFADLPLHGDLPHTELRNGVGIDRDKELAASKVLYDFEAVPPETQFELRVTVDNPTDEEVGLLLYLFSELDAGNLTLGGKTSRGLGRVRLTWERIEVITLQADNPFASLLSSRDLLARSLSEQPAPAEDAGDDLAAKLPTTGEPEAWRTVAEILLTLPKIEKGLLGEKAGERGVNKSNLNQKLALGLDERSRKAWDVVLERLSVSGFLIKKDDGYAVAGQEPLRAETAEVHGEPARNEALQKVIDNYVGAMARLWQEAA
jgi:CRISPR-associated RAMP protein (TIGR02581 family)